MVLGRRPTSPAALDWDGPLALWVGGETGAFPVGSEEREFDEVTIPMAGDAESLNVSVAGSLLLFAAGRVENGAS